MEILQNLLLLLQIFYYIITPLTLIFAVYQIKLSKEANYYQVFEKIYNDNLQVRKYFAIARTQIKDMRKEMSQTTEHISVVFNKEDYKGLRKLFQHYVFIGVLVENKMVPFNLVFDLIPFPDRVWDEAQDIKIALRQQWLPDMWKYAEILHDLYIKEQAKNSIQGKDFLYSSVDTSTKETGISDQIYNPKKSS